EDSPFEDDIVILGLPDHRCLQYRLQTTSYVFARQVDFIPVEIEGLKLADIDRRRFDLRDHASVGCEQLDPYSRWLEYAVPRVGIVQVGPGVTQRLPVSEARIYPDIFVEVYMRILNSAGVGRGRMRADCRLNNTDG